MPETSVCFCDLHLLLACVVGSRCTALTRDETICQQHLARPCAHAHRVCALSFASSRLVHTSTSRTRDITMSDLQTPTMTQTRLCTAQQVKSQDHGFGVSWASCHTFPRWRCRSAASLTMHEFNDAAIAKPSRDINHGTLDRPWSRVVRRRRRPDGDSPRRSAKGGSETAADKKGGPRTT